MSWYLSAMPREWIRKISFCKNKKIAYAQEHWYDAQLGADCWRVDDQLYLCGDQLIPQANMLHGFSLLESIEGLEQLCWSQADDISSFLADCISLEQLDMTGVDVSNVRNFSGMFSGCRKLREIKLHNWDLHSAENMSSLFEACLSLENVDVSQWNLEHVSNLSRMFLECNHLKELDVSCWNVSQVSDFSHMFSCCYQLENLDVSAWNMSSAVTMKAMFNRCYKLQELSLKLWNTAQAEDYTKLFHQCRSLKQLDLSSFKIRKNALFYWMFVGCPAKLKLPRDRRFRILKESDRWFRDYWKARDLNYISWIRIEKERTCTNPWRECPADELDSGSLICMQQGEGLILWSRGAKLYSNKNSYRAFTILDSSGRSWLREIRGLAVLDTRYGEDFREMFAGNGSLMTVDIHGFDLKNAKQLSGMFMACSSLRELDVSAWNTQQVHSMACLFDGCHWLRRLDVSAWNVEQLVDARGMFRHCKLLREVDISQWNCPNLQQKDEMFEGCEHLPDNLTLV